MFIFVTLLFLMIRINVVVIVTFEYLIRINVVVIITFEYL